MGIIILAMEIIFLTLLVMGLIYWLLSQRKPQPTQTIDKGIIHIVVENGAANKEKSTDRKSIINEAEALFQSLQKKYLYSPLPFKVLGDFYVQKGLSDKALEKYTQMVRYLNGELSLEKLAAALAFMRAAGAEAEALTIEAFYHDKEEG